MKLFFSRCRTLNLPLLNLISFLSTEFSCLSISHFWHVSHSSKLCNISNIKTSSKCIKEHLSLLVLHLKSLNDKLIKRLSQLKFKAFHFYFGRRAILTAGQIFCVTSLAVLRGTPLKMKGKYRLSTDLISYICQ